MLSDCLRAEEDGCKKHARLGEARPAQAEADAKNMRLKRRARQGMVRRTINGPRSWGEGYDTRAESQGRQFHRARGSNRGGGDATEGRD